LTLATHKPKPKSHTSRRHPSSPSIRSCRCTSHRRPRGPAPPEAPVQLAVQPHHQQPEVKPRRQLIRRPTPRLPIRSRRCASTASGATRPPEALAQPAVHPDVSPWRWTTRPPICAAKEPHKPLHPEVPASCPSSTSGDGSLFPLVLPSFKSNRCILVFN
uniref:Uncharacterized protein n=1 Tax=Triticum urartu TaxID=4572 RepID=A0A8R7PJK6_TRIUA